MELPPTIVVHSNHGREWEDERKLRIVYGCRTYRCTVCDRISPILRGDEKLQKWIANHHCKTPSPHEILTEAATNDVQAATDKQFAEQVDASILKAHEQPGSTEVGVIHEPATEASAAQ